MQRKLKKNKDNTTIKHVHTIDYIIYRTLKVILILVVQIGEETIMEKDETSDSASQSHSLTGSQSDSTPSSGTQSRPNVTTTQASACKPAASVPRLKQEEDDEPPRMYATEDTPLTGISRVSSLSSLTRWVGGRGGHGLVGLSLSIH